MINPLSFLPVWVFPLALVATAGITGWAGYSTGSAVKQGQWNAAIVAYKSGEDKALKAAAEAIAKIEVKSEQIIQPIRTEVRTNTVYRDCKHPDSVVRNLNALISGVQPAGSGIVPGAKSAR